MTFLYSIPSALLLLAAIAAAVLLACGGQTWVHSRFFGRGLVGHEEVGGVIIGIVGTLYAVVLAFFTVVAWQHFADARELVALESAAVTDAWHTAVGLPPPVRTAVRHDMHNYASAMVDREWGDMRRGEFDKAADMTVMDAISAAGAFVPANQGESNAQAATLQQLSVVHDDRLRRITTNAGGVSWLEWVVLLIGGSCVVCCCWLFELSNERTHLLLTSIVATILASVLILLFELQYPFRSDIGIGPDTWKATAGHIQMMETGDQMNMRM